MICEGCGEALIDDGAEPLSSDGKRHRSCVCVCHEKQCRKRCEDSHCLVCIDNVPRGPCKGECGCQCCFRSYQDFLSEDWE